jgi:hypothetical protein
MNTGWTSTRPYPPPKTDMAPCRPMNPIKGCLNCVRHNPNIAIRADERIGVIIDASLFLDAKKRCAMYAHPTQRQLKIHADV